jgi:hypothetical protein
MNLTEWTKIFLKQRDLIKRDIADIIETKEGFILHLKNGGSKQVFVTEELKIHTSDIIACLNTQHNLDYLVQNWKTFAEQKELLIIFAHPGKNDKWLLKPHHHHKVADDESLKLGLQTMFESVARC